MVKKGRGKGFEGLNKLDFKSLGDIWEQVFEAWDSKNYSGVASNLLALSVKMGEISPQLAPVIGAVIENYGTNMKPAFDQLFSSGTKGVGYLYEKATEAKKSLMPQQQRFEEAKAESYAMKVKALQGVKFSRQEAMDIILAEISGAKTSRTKALTDLSKNLPSPSKKRDY